MIYQSPDTISSHLGIRKSPTVTFDLNNSLSLTERNFEEIVMILQSKLFMTNRIQKLKHFLKLLKKKKNQIMMSM